MFVGSNNTHDKKTHTMTYVQQTPSAAFNAIQSRYATRSNVSFSLDTEGSNNWILHIDGTKYEVWNATLVVTNPAGHVINVQQFKNTLEAINATSRNIWKEIEAQRANA